MKNYYEILEISENASQEVIERVYKLLAKRYHPDMNLDNPKAAEEKFKEISEAYEVLSDAFKRENYNAKLKAEREALKVSMYNTINSQGRNINNSSYASRTAREAFERAEQQEAARRAQEEILLRNQKFKEQQMKMAYQEGYIKAMQNMGYKVVYKKSFRDNFSILGSFILTLIILAFIFFLMWIIPYTHERIIEIYDSSSVIKSTVEYIRKNT